MDKAFHQTLASTALLLLLMLLPNPAHSQTRRMCLTQLSLANQACSLLPLERPRDHIEELSEQHHQHHHHGGRRHGHQHHEERHGHRHQHHDHQHGSEHGEHHVHKEHHHHHGGPLREECCRWLKELDSACVCETLVRLPRFLLRPAHRYTVAVEDLCEVTYECTAV